MNQEYRDKIKEHKSTHTKMSAEDRAAVTTLESFLTSDGKINTSFSSDDKWPNHDGYFEFVSNPSLSRSPDQNFVVQIKGTHCYKETNGTISYSLTSLAFPAYIADEVTADPGILFVVLNPDVRGEKRVFWKYISPQVIEAIDFNKDSTTIKFSSDEEIFDTDESVENFCRSLEKIVSHHLFLRKLDMTSLSPEDALKIVDARCCDISEEIDRINQDNSSRDKFSRRIINCLYDLCYSALILNASRLGYKDINERFAWELSQFNISTKYLSVFLAGLKYIEHRIPDDGQSERLMLKYYSYLWEIRRFLYECFNKSVLQNLEAFPLDLDSVDTEYYEMIASSIENSTIIPSALRASRYYIQNSTPFFVNGERYFEITLQLAGLYATKFNRLTVYSKLYISSNYSIQISYCNVNINLWGKNNTIKFITGWKVAIDPICLNKLGKILYIPLKLNRTYAVPHSAPVAREDADENIQNTQDNVCHGFEDICNLLELPLKNRLQKLAESVPYSLDDLCDIFEVKPQRIDAVNNALTEAAEDRFYLLPDCRDLVAEVLIRAPQMHKSRHQCSDNCNDSDHRRTDTADHSAEGRKCGFCSCDHGRQIGNELHELTDCCYCLTGSDQ